MPKLYDIPTEFRIVDLNGVVLDNPGDYQVVEEPKSYEALRMTLERIKSTNGDRPRHGFNYAYGDPETPMTFIKASGYLLIQAIYEIDGTDAQIEFQFGTLNPAFEAKFVAQLDMNTYERTWVNGEPRIQVNVQAESVIYKLNSRIDTKVNLLGDRTFDGAALTPLEMEEYYWHGKVIKKSSRFEGISNSDYRQGGTDEYRHNEAFFLLIPANEVLNELSAFTYDIDQPFVDEGDFDGFFHFNAPDDGTYTVSCKDGPNLNVDFYNSNSNGTLCILEFCYKIGENGAINVIESWQKLPSDGDVYYVGNGNLSAGATGIGGVFETSFNLKLKKDENLYIFYRYRQFPESNDGLGSARRREFAFFNGFVNGEFTPYLQVVALTEPVTTQVKVLAIFEAINRLIEINTGLSNPLISSFYGRTDLGYAANGCGSKRWVTNGAAIRRFDEENRPPETTFGETMDSIQAIDHVGFGFENIGGVTKVILEEVSHFYKDAEILQIDQVLEYAEESADELIVNELIVAFDKYIEEELNTLDAHCTRAEYLTPIFTKQFKLELLSDWIADAYAIEYTRRKQFENSSTEKWRYDNDIFITDWVEITGIHFGNAFGKLNYARNADSPYADVDGAGVITIPLLVPELEDLTDISFGGNDYTVDTVEFDKDAGSTIITVNESTSVYNGPIDFDFGGGFSFKRPESDQSFSTIDNLISPETTYNLRMSLKRLLMKHAKWINSGLHYKAGTEAIINTFIDHNKTLTTQFDVLAECLGGDLGRVLLQENADLSLNDLANFGRYFIPTKVRYKAELSFEDNEYIRKALGGQSPDDNNYGYLSVLNEEGGYTKVFPNLHEYMPLSSIIEGDGYKKYDGV